MKDVNGNEINLTSYSNLNLEEMQAQMHKLANYSYSTLEEMQTKMDKLDKFESEVKADNAKAEERRAKMDKLDSYSNLTLEEMRAKMDKLDKFESKVTAHNGKAGEYVKELKAVKEIDFNTLLDSTENIVKRPQKSQIQVIEYEAAKVLFWRICRERMAQKGRKFVVDKHNTEVIVNLIKYFIHDKSSAYDLNKGILLTGDVGTGKTQLLSNFAVMAQVLNFKQFKTAICNEIYDNLLESSYQKRQGVNLKKYFKGHWSFDDIGDENASFQHYGNVIRPMDRIFSERYKNWTNGWCLTHGTTNLDSQELYDKYGKRVHSRIKEMFNIILLGGEDRRE